MAGDLKARLRRIRAGEGGPRRAGGEPMAQALPCAPWPGWEEAGAFTLKRVFRRTLPGAHGLVPSRAFPDALAAIVPDLQGRDCGRAPPSAGEFLFFDLETTGLSGAGAVAFLAAFGRFCAAPGEIEIAQYLLLDYPGEPDFLERVAGELSSEPPSIVASYNGKAFDAQIIRNRFLMNGMTPVEFRHADLLHPARRLWKTRLPSCSQGSIETSILGLDRSGDVSGALAPEIWFSFLRGGGNEELLQVCEHNARDVAGLASILLAFAEIAADPFVAFEKYRHDDEALALCWRDSILRGRLHFANEEARERHEETGERLLNAAAENGGARAAIALAKRAEWRLRDPGLALRYAEMALKSCAPGMREELERRRAR
ncbi:MAG: ribonuclease H-like domain-containing protein, partial [Treponema sp.]|nr:ribonuclease H-like domain-containing protein [Treponema sp.]